MTEQQQGQASTVVVAAKAVHAVPSLVVGIGAADGGVDALTALFIALDESAGMAFILTQHLVPQLGEEGANRLHEILPQYTELRVTQIHDGDRVEPDHIYLAPPGLGVEVQGLRFVCRGNGSTHEHAVDDLFRSLAHEFGPRAVGIVLSGAGNDGSVGVQRILFAGGMTLAQAPERAQNAAMPEAAIGSGAVQHVLSPFQIAEKLVEHCQQVTTPSTASVQRAGIEKQLQELQAANQELKRLNQRLFAIHGALHDKIQDTQVALAELQGRNEALARAHTDLSGLLCNTPIAMLFLDEQMVVQSFTAEVASIYAIQDGDVGKPLSMIEHRAHDMPSLPSPAELRSATDPQDDDVVTHERWYLRRAIPRTTYNGQHDGMVVTFIDVTKLKSSEATARPHEAWLRSITDAMPNIITYVDEAMQR